MDLNLETLAVTLASLTLSDAQRLRTLMLERMNIDLLMMPLHINEVREIQFYNPDNLIPSPYDAPSQTT